MWSPTHVQVTVQKAKALLTKGKNETNDAFVTISLGKEKYQTSVKEKASKDVEWHEECELSIPKQGNTAEIALTVLHRNFLGVDEFLGTTTIPLADFDVYERPRNRWYSLRSKPGKEKNKPRGELEVRVAFIVKAGSLTDLSKKDKHKSSLGQLSHLAQSVGGSLLSIRSIEKRKSLSKFAKSFGNKLSKGHKDKKPAFNEGIFIESQQVRGEADPGVISEGDSEDDFTFDDLSHKSSGSSLNINQQSAPPAPAPGPGPLTLNVPTSTGLPAGSLENLAGGEFLRRTSSMSSGQTHTSSKSTRSSAPVEQPLDEWEQKLYGKQGKENFTDTLKRRSWENSNKNLHSHGKHQEGDATSRNDIKPNDSSSSSPLPSSPRSQKMSSPKSDTDRKEERDIFRLAKKIKNFRKDNKLSDKTNDERIIIGGETLGHPISQNSKISNEILSKFEGKTREDLIELLCHLQATVDHKDKKLRDLEDYLDNLLLRVMETTPRILQNPYVSYKSQSKLA